MSQRSAGPSDRHALGVLAIAALLLTGGVAGGDATAAVPGPTGQFARGESSTHPAGEVELTRGDEVRSGPAPGWIVGDDPGASLERAAVSERLRPVFEPRRRSKSAVSSSSVAPIGQLIEILDLGEGSRVTSDGIVAAATHFGLEVDEPPTDADVARTLAAHRSSVVRRLRDGALSIGDRPGDADLRDAAAALGVTVSGELMPRDLERLARVASEPTPVFASTARVHVHAPSRHVHLVGFHQASFPVARQLNAHERVPMRTLPSRGRSSGNRSAADVSVEPDALVVAPVSGRVVEVTRYALYGRYADTRIRIVPDQNPDMLVSLLHVTGPVVAVGSRVVGGRTVVARHATKFPFVSQIDRFAGSYPHVHIEVRRR